MTLVANPTTIAAGQPALLTWAATNATTVTIGPDLGIGTLPLSGSATVAPKITTAYTITATGPGGNATANATLTVTPAVGKNAALRHIIFMLQENRSFDNYFGKLGQYRASRLAQMGIAASPTDVNGLQCADAQCSNISIPNRSGVLINPYHQRTVCTDGLSASWDASHDDAHLLPPATYLDTDFTNAVFGMDKFLFPVASVPPFPNPNDPMGTRPLGYYDETDLPYYYELATQFATSDAFFSSLLGNTPSNRMYMTAATSTGHVKTQPAGHLPYTPKTIFRALNEAGVTWRYYFQDNSVFLAEFADWTAPGIQSNVFPISNWYSVLSAPNADDLLPQVIFIERASTTGTDEHPASNIQKGAASVQQILSALMTSNAWQSSAFILSYDEGGGLYDHVRPIQVPPPDGFLPGQCPEAPCPLATGDTQGRFNLSGFRVPLIVVSPFVKPHFVSKKPRELTSILKLIETQFNVPPLTARDAWADDMSEFFDFVNPPAFPTPPALPVQPLTGTCDRTLEGAP